MNISTNVTKLLKRLLETKAETIKLGMDLHARDVGVCVQLDGALPERAQRMLPPELLTLVRGLREAGRKVFSCYEAGPCGYGLHRALLALGANNYVIAPEVLGNGRQQKTDCLDATALTDRLDRHVRGNTKAFTVVTVPSEAAEQARTEGRLRAQLQRDRHQWEARGRSLLLCHGHHVTGPWWTPRRWTELQPTLPAWLAQRLETMREVLLLLDAQEKTQRQALEATAPKALPKAVGALTWVRLARDERAARDGAARSEAEGEERRVPAQRAARRTALRLETLRESPAGLQLHRAVSGRAPKRRTQARRLHQPPRQSARARVADRAGVAAGALAAGLSAGAPPGRGDRARRGPAQVRGGGRASARRRPVALGDRPDHRGKAPPARARGGERLKT